MDLKNLRKIRLRQRQMIIYNETSIENYLHGLDISYNRDEKLREKVISFVTTFVKDYPYAFLNYCSRCGNCCKRENIYVKGGELFNLASHVGMGEEEFLRKYLVPCASLSPYDGFIKLSEGKCPFLEIKSTGRCTCTIYDTRPKSCREFLPASDICKKDTYDMIEEISYLEAEDDKISVEFRSGEFYQYKITETLGEKYKEILNILSEIDKDKLRGILEDIKDLLDALEKGELCNLDLKKHIDRLKKALKTIENEKGQGFSREEMETIRERLYELEKQGADKEIEEFSDEPGKTEGYLLSIENFSLKEVILHETFMTLFYRVSEKDYNFNLPFSEDEGILSGSRSFARVLTGLIREIFPRSLDNKISPCYMCGHCCSRFVVEIEPSDMRRLAEEFKITEEEFRERYMESPRYSFNPGSAVFKPVFDDRGKKRCVFLLQNDAGYYYCSVHHVKPYLCKIYRTGKPHCYNLFGEEHYYRLLSNIEYITLGSENLSVITAKGKEAKINWRNYTVMEEEMEKFMNCIRKYIVDRYFPNLQEKDK